MYKQVYILFIIVLVAGCTAGNDKTADGPVELHFDVNQELLSETIVLEDHGLSFQAPKHWERIGGEVFNEAVEQLTSGQSDSDSFAIIPRYIFLNQHHGSAMILSEIIPNMDIPDNTDIVKAFRADIRERFDDTEYRGTEFLKDGMYFYQYLIQKDNIVNFKFLFQNTQRVLYQLDFVVPEIVYAIESKAIESSIGTIKTRNN